ncbi:hypothetical protein PSACC_02897 [Paramicrosporidium saccamoebae]|uniref:Uncharacterized protein n=1 Tax=Paramicrosporidium saccamoebae TaxID=1246581 RepID=A0A2H9TI20_9FUNG|nr:hypothetical protein PSACC_02897 [Paramicrosporidium saccamoebae]
MAPRFLDRLTQKQRRPSRIHPKNEPTRDDSAPTVPITPCALDKHIEAPLQRKRKLITSINGAVKRVMTGFKKLTMRDVDLSIVHSVTFEPTVEMVTTPEQELRYRALRLDEMFGQFLRQCRELTAAQAEHISIPPELLQEMASYTKLLQTWYLKDVQPEVEHDQQDESDKECQSEVTDAVCSSDIAANSTTILDATTASSVNEFIDLSYQAKAALTEIEKGTVEAVENSDEANDVTIENSDQANGVAIENADEANGGTIENADETNKKDETLDTVMHILVEAPQAIYMPEEPLVSEADVICQDEVISVIPKSLVPNDSMPSLTGLFEKHNFSSTEAIDTLCDLANSRAILSDRSVSTDISDIGILSDRSENASLTSVQQRTSRSSFASNSSRRRMDPHIAYIVSLYESIHTLVADSDSE